MSQFPRALITGAARRVGAEIARQLHVDHDLLLHCRRSRDEAATLAATLEATRPRSTRIVAGELGDEDARAQLADAIGTAALDLVVFNASRYVRSDLAAVPADRNRELRDLLEVNVVATWDLALRLRPALTAAARARGDAAIVVILDIYAQRPLPGHEAYSISRAAGSMLVQALARAFGSEGIRVNGVAPGTVLWAEGPQRAETEALLTARTALGRIGSPADVAAAVRYLAGARYVTGSVLPVDGGRGTCA
ncbi:MAG: SDR family oxidoreductase [Xanthomonadaceae bacterium]|nr:SDR family oxidoreductase [Xanthomonadaceae bacterium]MDE1958128.1 SDR family oxidoreductase [Xanthomonadaceae bacterium]MDE2178047.1 SDR family oxidoreductase [Xanthomonadaceae bacterium]MDE2245170.1 SDR family oxidoreductase [Xanthomonadaceae bacterium]